MRSVHQLLVRLNGIEAERVSNHLTHIIVERLYDDLACHWKPFNHVLVEPAQLLNFWLSMRLENRSSMECSRTAWFVDDVNIIVEALELRLQILDHLVDIIRVHLRTVLVKVIPRQHLLFLKQRWCTPLDSHFVQLRPLVFHALWKITAWEPTPAQLAAKYVLVKIQNKFATLLKQFRHWCEFVQVIRSQQISIEHLV